MFELGQQTSWTLPSTDEGTTIEFSTNHQIASFFKFDATTSTITFDGQNFLSSEKAFVDKVFFMEIRLIDENDNVTFVPIPVELQKPENGE